MSVASLTQKCLVSHPVSSSLFAPQQWLNVGNFWFTAICHHRMLPLAVSDNYFLATTDNTVGQRNNEKTALGAYSYKCMLWTSGRVRLPVFLLPPQRMYQSIVYVFQLFLCLHGRDLCDFVMIL